jgi:hypothetical protein
VSGPITGKGVWGIRANQELRKLYKGPVLVPVDACNKNEYNKGEYKYFVK